MNRNKLYQFLPIVLILAVLLTACSGKQTEEKAESDPKAESSQGQENHTGGENEIGDSVNQTETDPDSSASGGDSAVSNSGGDTTVSNTPSGVVKPGATTDAAATPGSSGNGSLSGATEPGSSGSGETGNAGSETNGNTGSGNTNNSNTQTGNTGGGNQPEQSEPSKEPEKPSGGESQEPSAPKPDTSLTYAEYLAMTPAEQQAYYETYTDVTKFIAWHNAAKAEYEANKDSIEIEGGNIDIGEIMNGKN